MGTPGCVKITHKYRIYFFCIQSLTKIMFWIQIMDRDTVSLNLRKCHMTSNSGCNNEFVIFEVKNEEIIIAPKNGSYTTKCMIHSAKRSFFLKMFIWFVFLQVSSICVLAYCLPLLSILISTEAVWSWIISGKNAVAENPDNISTMTSKPYSVLVAREGA